MNLPSQTWVTPEGDLYISPVRVVSFNSGSTASFRTSSNNGVAADSGNHRRIALPVGAATGQALVGGSGRNYILTSPEFGMDRAVFKPVSPGVWESAEFPDWTLTLDGVTGDITLNDGADDVAASSGGYPSLTGVTSAGTVPSQGLDFDFEDGGYTVHYLGASDASFYLLHSRVSGDAALWDGTTIVAERLGGSATTPDGAYTSTLYGEATYNSSAPFTFTVSGGGLPSGLTATTDGEDNYNGGSPFSADIEFEGDISGQAAAVSFSDGTAQAGTYAWAEWQLWTSEDDSDWTITIDGSGAGELSDGTDVVAERAADANKLYDPGGAWTITSYGLTNYADTSSVTTGSPSAGTVETQSFVLSNTVGAVEYYTGTVDSGQYITLDTVTGDAILLDGSDEPIAERPGGSTSDINGSYTATTYGEDTFNTGSAFTFTVATTTEPVSFGGSVFTMPKLTMAGFGYVVLTVNGSNEATAISGPYFAAALPANSSTEISVPILESDGAGALEQIWIGAIPWQP